MAQQPPRRGGAPDQDPAAFTFVAKVENEEQLLDAVLASLARGAFPADAWERLHAAAARDGRTSELAFAFETVSQGKRLKTVPPQVAAEFLYQAARFFADVFGDELGAISCLERALAAAPTHAAAMGKIEELLVKAGQQRKLAEILGANALHRPKGDQAPLLRRAAALLSKIEGADDKMTEVLQHLVKADPGDEDARGRLEVLYVKANRFRDVLRLCEQALAAVDPAPGEATKKKLLARVVELYADKLHEPERAMPHVEALLALDPASEDGRRVAQKLVVIKGLAGRAAAALATACEAYGTPQEVARYLTIELENTRGPKRAELLARLGKLRHERMADDKGAFEAFEQALAIDATDDELRARYLDLAGKLARHADAAKTLARLLATAKDAAVKAKTSAQLGQMLLLAGDPKRARSTLAAVLATPDAPADAMLAAAHTLREILEKEKDGRALLDVLERIATLEPDAEKRREVDERLSDLATLLKDAARAIAANERLLSTKSRARALAALAPLYEASGAPDKLARLLEERAKDTVDAAEARSMLLRAAEVRTRDAGDAPGAIATYEALVARFGWARDVVVALVPLLEGERRWDALADALSQGAGLSNAPGERAGLFAQIGALRALRLRDPAGAVTAFARALAEDPAEKTSRATLEKLVAHGEHRLEAARVLEGVYRSEGAGGALLKILEVVGSLEAAPEGRLAALREATDLAGAASGPEGGRAIDLAGRGLTEAVGAGQGIGEWLERLDRAGAPGTDPKRRAGILARALGERDVTSEDLSLLAKRTAEAFAACGEVDGAIALYRRALAFEPHSAELLARIDELLRERGTPAERVALYAAALEGSSPARARELRHRIGAIQRKDLGDAEAASSTYRTILETDPDDADAYAALEEIFAQAGRWADLCALLEGRVARVSGDVARAVRATLARVAAEHGDAARARTQCARLLEDPELGPEALDAVELAAEHLGDPDLARAVLHRRAEMARDPHEQIGWLERLARLDAEKRGDLESAAAVWKRAADLADQSGDDANARRLYWDARKVAPEDPEINTRLAGLCERAGSWADLPRLYAAIADQSTDDAERVTLALRAAEVLEVRLGDTVGATRQAERAFEIAPTRPDTLAAFERLSVASGTIEAFEQAVDAALARSGPSMGADSRGRLPILLARARVVGNDPKRIDEAARAYRDILADVRVDPAHQATALAAFEALVAAGADSVGRRADRRWLFEWRAEHAAEAERTLRLLEWARQEESAFGDLARALTLHRRVLGIDSECDESLSAVARLALALGDADEALVALRARRERAAGPARVGIDLEIAQVLLSRPGGAKESIASLRAVLAEAPGDATALALAAQLLMNRATRSEAVTILEAACEATEDFGARAQILARLLDAPSDDDDANARHRWYERLCDLQRDSGDVEGALATSIRATRETPQVAALWERAEALARKVSRPDDVAALYAEVLARTLPRDEALAMGERAVQFYEEWFEDRGRVVRILERVLEIDPAADWAFDRLKLVFDSAERWDELFALYDRALESASDAKRTSLLEDAAQTAKDFANRPDRAIQYLEQLHELRPGDAKLASALERLYERQGRHRELVTLLGERMPSLKREDARRTRLRVATLWLDELGDPSAALDQVEPLLASTGDGANGVASDVWTLLERVLAAAPPTPEPRKSSMPPPPDAPPKSKRPRKSEPPSSAKGSVRKRTAAWLREHYTATGRDADLARMLLVDLEGVRVVKERVRRHLQVAAIYEKVGTLPEALEQTGLAFVLAPDAEDQRAKLGDLAERTGRLERLAELLAAGAEAAEDQTLRTSLTMQAATVRADRLSDAPGAIALLASVLAARRVPDEDVLLAARRLDPLLESAGRAEERLEVLERIASVERDEGARREAIGRAAVLAAGLGQDERAIGLWERRLSADERDAEALDGLVDLLDRTGKSARLAEVLALRADAAPADDRRRADRVRLAKLLGETLGRREEAIDAWRGIERDFGEADDAALALAGLLRATERWADLAALLERGAGQASDAGTRAELLQQLGDVQRERLAAHGAAVETYARSLAADPRNAGARAGLLVLASDGAHAAAAVDLLLGALRTCDDWRAVLELTEHRLNAAAGRDAKIDVLLESAEIAERRAGDAGLGFEAVRRAAALAPGESRVRAELGRLAEVTGAWRDLVATYLQAIDGAARGDTPLVADLWHATAKVLEERLDDARGALEAYRNVVALTAEISAGSSAVRVAARLGEWSVAATTLVDLARARGEASLEAIEAFEQEASRSSSWDAAARAMSETLAGAGLAGPAARDLYARLASWQRDRRSDSEAAQGALRRALEHDPSNAALLRELAELERRSPGRPLVETLTRLSRATGGDAALLREAAEAARDSVGDRELARSILGDLFDLAKSRWLGPTGAPGPVDAAGEAPRVAEWTVETLAELHEADGNARGVLDVLVAGDALPFDLPVRRGMRRRAARVAIDRLNDAERGIALFLALLDEDPRDAEAVERLGATYRALDRTRDLLRLRERQVAATDVLSERLALRLEAATLHQQLGDVDAAVAVLRESLTEQATHEATVEALAASLEGAGRWVELRTLLADQAERAEAEGNAARAAELWSRAASLAEDRLRDASAAAIFHARVVALEPRAASFDALARLSEARSEAATAAGWLEKLLGVVEADRAGASALRLAEALVASGDAGRAAERLEEWVGRVSDAEPLRARLAALYRDQRQWPKLAALAAESAAHAPDKTSRMARLLEAAKLFIERCAEPARAVPLLEQASDLAPEDPSVRLGLADALAQANRFDEARAILQAMVAAFGGRRPKERAPVHYQTARLELAMGNRASALVELDVATRIDPQNPEILRTLAELARDDGQLERAEKSYRALLAVLKRREDARDVASIARSEVLLELSAIAERDGETERAKEILESAVEAAAHSDFEQERLEAVLRKRGDDATLVRVLEAKLAHLGDTPAAAKALGELADVLVERMGRPDQALAARLRALSIDARSPAAHDAALALARSQGALDRYLDHATSLASAAVEAGDAASASALFLRLGGVAEADLNDDRKAAALYERAVDLGLRSPDLLRSLDRLFERLGDTSRQARVLAVRIEVESAGGGRGAASDATYRLAALRLASKEGFAQGVEMLGAALDAEPDYDRARGILEKAVAVDASHPALVDLYERVGRQPGQERALVDALRLRIALPASGVETVREAVEVATRLGDADLARSLLARFVEARTAGGAVGNVADLAWALRELSRLHEAAGDLRKAVELRGEAAKVAEPDEARLLRLEVAAIAADKLNDLGLAAELYETVRAIDPVDREAWEPLVAVYRRMGAHQKLADLLGVVVDFVEEAPERARLRLERLRTMTEHLGMGDEGAARELREIVDEDPGLVDAALTLAAILERTGKTEELAELLARQFDAARDRGEAAAVASLALKLGAMVQGTDRPRARDVYYTGIDWEPKNRALLDALLALLDGDDDASERADLLEKRLAAEDGPKAEEMARALRATRLEQGDEAAAERALEVGFRAYPQSAALRDELEAAYKARSDWKKLAELYGVDAAARKDANARAARWREAAALLREKLGDSAGAAAMLERAHAAVPSDPGVLEEYAGALVDAGDGKGAAAVIGEALGQPDVAGAARAALLGRRAAIHAAAGDHAAALEDLEGAFAIDRERHAVALAGALAAAEASAAGDAERVRLLRLRHAQVLPYAGGVDLARTILGTLLESDPRDREALRTLAALESALELWDAASGALRRLVGLEEGAAAVEVALSLADACERAGRSADARAALERARSTARGDAGVQQRLERLYEQTGAWHELADLVLESASAAGDVANRFALLVRAGLVLLEQAGDPDAAIAALEQAKALRPGDADCIGPLAEAYTLAGRGTDAIALLDSVLAPTKGKRTRELSPLYWRQSRVLQHAGDAAGEQRALVIALECDSQNGEVCAAVAMRALETDQLDLATRALRAVTMLKTPGPMPKGLAYQYMGEIAIKQSDVKRALTLLKRACAEDPSLESAKELLQSIERGEAP
jgi:tetratricopeptide (TPR) repeat protein